MSRCDAQGCGAVLFSPVTSPRRHLRRFCEALHVAVRRCAQGRQGDATPLAQWAAIPVDSRPPRRAASPSVQGCLELVEPSSPRWPSDWSPRSPGATPDPRRRRRLRPPRHRRRRSSRATKRPSPPPKRRMRRTFPPWTKLGRMAEVIGVHYTKWCRTSFGKSLIVPWMSCRPLGCDRAARQSTTGCRSSRLARIRKVRA